VSDRGEFIRAHLTLAPVTFVPDILLHQAQEPIGLWELTEGEYRSDQPPPFWAFAWAGGTALARYLLDHPDEVAGRGVLDLAAGSGLVAVAAAKSGAATVLAIEIDPLAAAAISLNAAENGVDIQVRLDDVLDQSLAQLGLHNAVVLAGDVFYSQEMSRRMLTFLRRAARDGADVLVGDPGRAYFPTDYFTAVHTVEVPVRPELESTNVRSVTVYRINPGGAAAGAMTA
jgi:predicted nicotinamide N-methyase